MRFLCRQTDIKTMIVRQASKATRSSPEASMVATGSDGQVVMSEMVGFILSGKAGQTLVLIM